MFNGPGKYDQVCTDVFAETEAKLVGLIVIDGKKGSGFSVQGDINNILKLPEYLRDIARQIDEQIKSS